MDAHNRTIAERWRSRVLDEDTVVLLGDVILGNKDAGIQFFSELPGRKVLVQGNHDPGHPSYRKKAQPHHLAAGRARYASVFEVREELIVSGDEFGLPGTILCHFPWSDSPDHAEDRTLIEQYGPNRTKHVKTTLIHGHVHSPEKVPFRHTVHVGVDAWLNGPASLDEVRSLVRESHLG